MNNTLFIQFYSNFTNTNALCNGFSDTYDYCRNLGDFIWLNENDLENFKFPFKKGIVYISAYFLHHIYQAEKWALQYPRIRFIVGGPAAMTFYDYQLNSDIHIVKGSVEDYFNIKNFSCDWNLDIKQINNKLDHNQLLCFSYTINTACYWHKCIYCNYYFVGNRERNLFNPLVFDKIEFDGNKQVRLNSPGFKSKHIEQFLPLIKYDDHMFYDILMRCDKKEYTALQNVLKSYKVTPNLKIRLGVEFPSNHMLKHMNKGFTVDDVLKTMNIIKSRENVKLYIQIILGWPSLTENDINELKSFIERSPHIDCISIHSLFCQVNTKAHDIYIDRRIKKTYENNYYKGFFPKLTDKERELNNKAKQLLKDGLDVDFFYAFGPEKETT